MKAEEMILNMSIKERKYMLARFIQDFIDNLKNGNDKEAEFYAICCRTVARYIV